MAYNKTIWQDRVVEKPRTYTMTDNGDGTVTLTPAPGNVVQAGTPVNATNMNKIEQGIADAQNSTKNAEALSGWPLGRIIGLPAGYLSAFGGGEAPSFTSNGKLYRLKVYQSSEVYIYLYERESWDAPETLKWTYTVYGGGSYLYYVNATYDPVADQIVYTAQRRKDSTYYNMYIYPISIATGTRGAELASYYYNGNYIYSIYCARDGKYLIGRDDLVALEAYWNGSSWVSVSKTGTSRATIDSIGQVQIDNAVFSATGAQQFSASLETGDSLLIFGTGHYATLFADGYIGSSAIRVQSSCEPVSRGIGDAIYFLNPDKNKIYKLPWSDVVNNPYFP
jgi:hypothetical protein